MPESSDKPFKIASILRVANGKCMFFFVRPRYFDFFLKKIARLRLSGTGNSIFRDVLIS